MEKNTSTPPWRQRESRPFEPVRLDVRASNVDDAIAQATKAVLSHRRGRGHVALSLVVDDVQDRLPTTGAVQFSLDVAVRRFLSYFSDDPQSLLATDAGNPGIPLTADGSRFGPLASGLNQIEASINRLRRDRHSTVAAAVALRPSDARAERDADVHRLIAIRFSQSGGRLVTAGEFLDIDPRRLAYTIYELSLVAELAAVELGLELGPLLLNSMSAAVEPADAGAARAMVSQFEVGVRGRLREPPIVLPSGSDPLRQIRDMLHFEVLIRASASAAEIEGWLSTASVRLDAFWLDILGVLAVSAARSRGWLADADRLEIKLPAAYAVRQDRVYEAPNVRARERLSKRDRLAIEQAASQALRDAGCETFPVDLDRVLAKIGIRARRITAAPGKEARLVPMPGDDGLYDLHLPAGEGDQRQRFTIAHEIGHAVLHEPAYALNRDGRHTREEHEANYFAGALLMPEAAVRAELAAGRSVEDLGRRFGVNPAVVSVRLRDIGLS